MSKLHHSNPSEQHQEVNDDNVENEDISIESVIDEDLEVVEGGNTLVGEDEPVGEEEDDNESVNQEDPIPEQNIRTSTRITYKPIQYKADFSNKQYCHFQRSEAPEAKEIVYDNDTGRIAANVIQYYCMAQQYLLKKGLQKFGTKGYEATYKEMKQLHDREVFGMMDMTKLTHTQ